MLAFVDGPPASLNMLSVTSSSKCLKEASTSSDPFFLVALWFVLSSILYHHVVLFLQRGGWSEALWRLKLHWKALKHGHVCPKRRARFLKCARRCHRRNHGASSSDSSSDSSAKDLRANKQECCVEKYFKLHLPPPLPFTRRRKKCCQGQPELSQSSSSTLSSSNTETLSVSSSSESSAASSVTKRAPPPAAPQIQLLDLARMQQWSVIQQAIPIARKQAKQHDADGLYPLHWACSGGPPVSVVQALLDAYPSAVRKRDVEGSTPLHFASHYSASLAVMEALLKAYPRAIAMQDQYGRTPLYHAVDKKAAMAILELLATANPAMITTPCLAVADRHLVTKQPPSRSVALRTPLFLAWAAVVSDKRTRETQRGKIWDKAVLLLELAYLYQSNLFPRVPHRSLHAAIELDVYLPEPVVTLLLQADPEQAQQEDSQGLLPLSLAAGGTFQYSSRRSETLIRELLKAWPAAAKHRDPQGRFALAAAVAAGKSWQGGTGPLFEAAPETMTWRDGVTGLVPALLAATAQYQEGEDSGNDEMEVSLSSLDPYGLLNAKQRERLLRPVPQQRRMAMAAPGENSETRQVSTLLELLQADPSVLVP